MRTWNPTRQLTKKDFIFRFKVYLLNYKMFYMKQLNDKRMQLMKTRLLVSQLVMVYFILNKIYILEIKLYTICGLAVKNLLLKLKSTKIAQTIFQSPLCKCGKSNFCTLKEHDFKNLTKNIFFKFIMLFYHLLEN